MAGIQAIINGLPAFLDFPDAYGEAMVDGVMWRWEFHEYLGPGWLRKDGEPRKCQCPRSKKVWAAFEKWLKKYQKTKKPNEIHTTRISKIH